MTYKGSLIVLILYYLWEKATKLDKVGKGQKKLLFQFC